MKCKLAAFAAAALLCAGLGLAGASPASAHGTWPDVSTTGPTQSQTTSVGDQIFTTCGSPPCLHYISRANVNGTIYASNGNFVIVTDSIITGDGSDAFGVETGADGFIEVDDSIIKDDFTSAGAYGRTINIKRTEFDNLPYDGFVMGMGSLLQDSWMHNWNVPAMTVGADGIQVFDVWSGHPGTFVQAEIDHNMIEGDYSTLWSAIWVSPDFGGSSSAIVNIHDNFFVGGAWETIHITDSGVGSPDSYVDLPFMRNHVLTGSTITITATNARTCENEDDDYMTASYMSGALGASC